MKKIRTFFLINILLSQVNHATAQQAVLSGGGNASNGNGGISYSLGQLSSGAYGNPPQVIIEGLQQPAELFAALPVLLVYFTASLNASNQVVLDWATSTEINNSYFTIERSTDGRSFSDILKINGAGSTGNQHNYSATDNNPLSGVSYYRLKQTDADGKIALFQIVKVVVSSARGAVTALPNPAINNLLLSVNTANYHNLHYALIDEQGKIVKGEKITGDVTNINVRALAPGAYVLKVFDNTSQVQNFKIIKQ